MSTRNIKDAKDLNSGELIYFKGHAKATYMSDGTTVEDKLASMKSAGNPVVNHGTEDTTFILTPNTFHVWGTVDSLILDLGAETEGILNEYFFQFESGETPTSLTLPNSIKWTNSVPEIKSGYIYQISILNGMGIALSFNSNIFELTTGRSKAGDIAYWDGSMINTVSCNNWNSSLGTPIGVVVVPTGFAPDGKTRIVSLYWASETNTLSKNPEFISHNPPNNNAEFDANGRVPKTDNLGGSITSDHYFGNFPSDMYLGIQSYVDPKAFYGFYASNGGLIEEGFIPSPYLGDEPNPEYYSPIENYNNLLSYFDGYENTDKFVTLAVSSAIAARNYQTIGFNELTWHLPDLGEMGYLLARYNLIQESLTELKVSQLIIGEYAVSSKYTNGDYMRSVNSMDGEASTFDKCLVRPFAIID